SRGAQAGPPALRSVSRAISKLGGLDYLILRPFASVSPREVPMQQKKIVCPDCEALEIAAVDRRGFIKTAAAAATAAASGGLTLWATPKAGAAPTPSSVAETAVKALYETLTDTQKKEICF